MTNNKNKIRSFKFLQKTTQFFILAGVFVSSFTALNGSASVQAPQTPRFFSDVPSNHTFANYINSLRENNIIDGYPDGTYKPENLVNRGAMAKFIFNGFKLTEKTDCGDFSDVPKGSPFYKYITSLKCNNVIAGYPDGSYRPNSQVNRGAMAKFIFNGANLQQNLDCSVANFTDTTGNTFANEIRTLQCDNIIGGYPDGTYQPTANVNRGAMAKFIDNARSVNVANAEAKFEVKQKLGSENDRAISEAEIRIFNQTGELLETVVSDNSGKASLNLDSNKNYTYQVLAEGFAVAEGDVKFDEVISLELAEAKTATITVKDESNNPLENAVITISPSDGNTLTKAIELRTYLNEDEKVEAKISLAEGKYDYSISKVGYKTLDVKDVPMGNADREISFELEQVKSKVSFNVKNSGGSPITNQTSVTISNINEEGEPKTVVNNKPASDNFDLPNGQYQYEITCANTECLTPAKGEFSVNTADRTIDVKFYEARFLIVNKDGNPINNAKLQITKPENLNPIPAINQNIVNVFNIPNGDYTFTITAPDGSGYVTDEQRSFTINNGNLNNQTITLYTQEEIDKQMPTVSFNLNPADAKVIINDGKTDEGRGLEDGKIKLLPGRYEYTVTAKGYATETKVFNVEEDTDKTIIINLTKVYNVKLNGNQGDVQGITVETKNGIVSVNGKKLENLTPDDLPTPLELPVGKYTVSYQVKDTSGGFRNETKDFEVVKDEGETLTIDLN